MPELRVGLLRARGGATVRGRGAGSACVCAADPGGAVGSGVATAAGAGAAAGAAAGAGGGLSDPARFDPFVEAPVFFERPGVRDALTSCDCAGVASFDCTAVADGGASF